MYESDDHEMVYNSKNFPNVICLDDEQKAAHQNNVEEVRLFA